MPNEQNPRAISFARLEDFKGGWFVGNFVPSLFPSKEVEVSVKRYRAGDSEAWHEHRVATEFTVVVDGTVEMAGALHGAGTIVVIPPGCGTAFLAVTDAVTTVVKLPSVPNDKYTSTDA